MLVALDCANAQRMGEAATLLDKVPLSLDVDHHHDNTEFAKINFVVPDASSTGEIVRDILRELGVELTPEIAEALYVALVTDTGRFQYTNTSPKALRLAAELVEAGVDVHRVFQGIYESVEFAKLKLLARALERAEIYDGGRLVISHLKRTDFTDLGVGEEYAEGIIDYLRAVDGTDMAAVIREPPEPPDAKRRVSLRASHDELDVSAIARARGGWRASSGGGVLERRDRGGDRGVHPGRIRSCLRARLGRRVSFSWTSRRGRRRSQSSSSYEIERARAPAMREPWTRSQPGCCSCCSARRLVSRSTSSGSTSATSRKSISAPRPPRATSRAIRTTNTSSPTLEELHERLELLLGDVTLRVPAASAVKVAGERAYKRFRAGEDVDMPYRTSTIHELELHAYDEGVATLELLVSSGTYVRAIADALGGHCRTLRRTAVGPFSVDDADEERILTPAEALPFLPAIDLSPDEADAIRNGRRRIEQPVRAMCEGELVAVDGTVMP